MKFFHFLPSGTHRPSLKPLFDELERRGWVEGATRQLCDVAFVISASRVTPERLAKSPLVWLPHGLSPAKWAFPSEVGRRGAPVPSLLLLPGRFFEQRLRLAGVSHKRILPRYEIVGWPKSDSLFDGSIQPLKCKHPMVLFAPSWNKKRLVCSGVNKFAGQVASCLRGVGTLICAPHPIDRPEEGKINKGTSLNSYLLAADVVVTDQSSIAIEAALIDKPVVHLFELYKLRGWTKQDGEQFVVGHMATLETLRENVLDALAHPERYSFMRRYWREAMLSYPGKGSVRAADAVERLVGVNG